MRLNVSAGQEKKTTVNMDVNGVVYYILRFKMFV